VDLHFQDTLVSFDIVSLFTNVPVDEALEVVKNKINNEDTRAVFPNLFDAAMTVLLIPFARCLVFLDALYRILTNWQLFSY
jgi:hypothetical protein